MQFLMLMIPKVYRDNEMEPGFVPELEEMEEMRRFNEEMGKSVKILSLNGLHPLKAGTRVSFGSGKPVVTDGPFIEAKEVLGCNLKTAFFTIQSLTNFPLNNFCFSDDLFLFQAD